MNILTVSSITTVRICLLILALSVAHFAFSIDSPPHRVSISKDSLLRYPNYLDKCWRYANGDDPNMRLPSYDDAFWQETDPALDRYDSSAAPFSGVGWFRLHFDADSTVTAIPLAMTITHFGASEIYLDGKLLKSYGRIQGADSSSYEDPQELPFIFILQDTGAHVLAVRYANYDAERNLSVYKQGLAGFRIMVGTANDYIETKNERSTIFSFIAMLLAGIFFALSLIHLFMFLYYRRVKSNLYFSIFMLSLAGICLLLFIFYASTTPSLVMKGAYLPSPIFMIACIALSGFINELFARKKTMHRIIVAIGAATLITWFFGFEIYSALTAILVIGVSLVALIMVIVAIVRKVKGALIIGSGILLFVLFILTMVGVALLQKGDFSLNDSTAGGRFLILFLCLAILSIPFSMSVYLAWNFASINKHLAQQLEQVKVLSQKTIEQEQEKQRMLENRKEELEKEVMARTAELRLEKKKSDDLLLNILPEEVAEELKAKGEADAKLIDEVTVLFTDFKGFTSMSEKLTPKELVKDIHECFSAFDRIMEKHGMEKIKTIGDAYMAAGGIPSPNKTHAHDAVKAALDILQFIAEGKAAKIAVGAPYFDIRIGIHTGPVVAGIVGVKKFAYDIWGDTVNTASRMESSGEVSKVNISETTYALVKEKFACTHRGKIEAKGKGEIDMYFVEGTIGHC